jgi:CxxC motif-containing protein (DUF1111 family)
LERPTGEARHDRTIRLTLLTIVALSVIVALVAAHQGEEPDDDGTLASRGALVFTRKFTSAQGLGPLFNRESCVACHASGGMGPNGLGTATRVGRLIAGGFDPMIGEGGPIARARSVHDADASCDLSAGIPSGANVTSVRNAPDLHGTGLLDAISDDEIAAGAVARGDGVHGRVHRVRDAGGHERVGRFGWKAETATLKQFIADAFRNELGITSPLAPVDLLPSRRPGWPRCLGEGKHLEDDGTMVDAATAFLRSLSPYVPRSSSASGAALFKATGCVSCHTPSLAVGGRRAWLYSDLLLHDVGRELDDKVVQGDARGRDWRTTPLWGLGRRERLLHDGRARTIAEAINAHGGEAQTARSRFRALSADQARSLLTYLESL